MWREEFPNIFFPILSQGQQQNERESDLMTVRERQLQIQVEDLRDKLRHQQETFADDKRQLVSGNIIFFSIAIYFYFFSYGYFVLENWVGFRRLVHIFSRGTISVCH